VKYITKLKLFLLGVFIYFSRKKETKLGTDYFTSIVNLVKTGYKTNAFAPYVWFTAVVAVVEIIIMIIISDMFVRRTLTITLVATILFGMYMYYQMFKKDPRLLQSESFRLEDKKLDMIGQKGSDIMINPVNLSVRPQLLEEGGENA
jgi:hypothetical protein